MDVPNITDITSVLIYLHDGTNNLFFDILMLPIFFVVLISCRNMNVGDNIDCMNISSFVCLILSFTLSSVQLCSFIIVGVFLGALILGLLLKRFT